MPLQARKEWERPPCREHKKMERLQKIIARAGIASRRKAEELILAGGVELNGSVVRKLGVCADPSRDHIRVNGKRIHPQPLEYYALNKPRAVVSSVQDEKGRRTVTDLVQTSVRLYPAGRLDYESEGLIILTNDGDLSRRLTKAGHVPKHYRVKVRGQPSERLLDRLRSGIRLAGEGLAPCQIKMVKPGNNSWLTVTLRQGRYRQIRRMFGSVRHPVMRLRRVSIGSLKLGNLKPGESRHLSPEEVRKLYSGTAPARRPARVPPRTARRSPRPSDRSGRGNRG